MSNTIDLVKAAQNREYSNFEDMAKEALMTKIGENLQLKGFMNKLDVAKGLAEADELSPKQKKLDKDKDGKIGSDDLKKVRNEWIILDFKQKLPFQNKIPEHYKAQLTSEAIALECAKNIKVSWIQLQFPGGRRITEELTDSDKMRTLRAIAELRYMLKTEQIPEPTKSSRKCKDCEYRKICLPL